MAWFVLPNRSRKRGDSSGQANHCQKGILISFRLQSTRCCIANDVSGQHLRLFVLDYENSAEKPTERQGNGGWKPNPTIPLNYNLAKLIHCSPSLIMALDALRKSRIGKHSANMECFRTLCLFAIRFARHVSIAFKYCAMRYTSTSKAGIMPGQANSKIYRGRGYSGHEIYTT
jgi:hypothetical protein